MMNLEKSRFMQTNANVVVKECSKDFGLNKEDFIDLIYMNSDECICPIDIIGDNSRAVGFADSNVYKDDVTTDIFSAITALLNDKKERSESGFYELRDNAGKKISLYFGELEEEAEASGF